MFCAFFTLLMLYSGVGVLAWFVERRLARRLQQDPEAARLLAEHVVVPLLVGKESPEAEPKKIKGVVV